MLVILIAGYVGITLLLVVGLCHAAAAAAAAEVEPRTTPREAA
jgi:hypothetical protein